MSVYAFDLDGTLTRAPIAQLARDLEAAGHTIHVVSGWLEHLGPWEAAIAAKAEQLRALGLSSNAPLHLCRGSTQTACAAGKAEALRRIGPLLFIDDMPLFCDASPIQALCVWRAP